jgi:hypothetical protein
VAAVRTEARFEGLPAGAGHYESFYLKAASSASGRALWIRHTVHKRPGAEPTAAVWFVLFGGGAAPRAAKQTFGADSLEVPEGSYVRVADARIGPGKAAGSIATPELEARWDLRFDDLLTEKLRHLPSDRMYRAPLPRTKLESPHPAASFSGTVEVGGELLTLDGWPGMVGHNWGTEHAERWAWIHAAGFEGGVPGDHLDVAAGRVRIGPVTTRWIANGQLVLGGETYRLGGVTRAYGTEIEEQPTECRFVLPGKGIAVRGSVGAAASEFVGWIYADPGGGEHHAVNSSVANLEMRIERPGRKHVHLQVGGAAYELGMRETDHGIPIQPYPDG